MTLEVKPGGLMLFRKHWFFRRQRLYNGGGRRDRGFVGRNFKDLSGGRNGGIVLSSSLSLEFISAAFMVQV